MLTTVHLETKSTLIVACIAGVFQYSRAQYVFREMFFSVDPVKPTFAQINRIFSVVPWPALYL